ncbi:hypothetical protein BLNAU_3282 [Blattamonas nauphoetae]|uniref:Uncharacterized protein n=1 Tax=Blattamonas nauphoetae TaxID=2049346 RepID=A0ABQ9YDQ6_9EUKA|nr:hypothetical protein BLNAU_3282 [Blattamonas nauphoetae]
MISSEKYSAFLKLNENDPVKVDSVAHAFVSLVSMLASPIDRLFRTIFEGDWTRLPKSRCNLCGFDGCALVVAPSLNIQRFSLIHSGILSTPHLRDLSLIDNERIMSDILIILNEGVRLSFEYTLHISPSLSTLTLKLSETCSVAILTSCRLSMNAEKHCS